MKKAISILLLALFVGTAVADDPAARLNQALKNMDNVTTDFKQTLLDEDKNVVQNRGSEH